MEKNRDMKNSQEKEKEDMDERMEEELEEELEEDINEDAEEKGEDVSDSKKGNGLWKELFSWVRVFAGAFIIAYILSNYVIVNANIPSGSMLTTIKEGDKVMGFRLSYVFSEPKRGDIVMFEAPDKEDTIYIKRIIGCPGETVRIDGNAVYITHKNGKEEKLEEKYIKNGWTNAAGWQESGEWILGKNEYFMMGDNRDHSHDSRYWGTVKKSKIIAKAIFKYYPSVKSLT